MAMVSDQAAWHPLAALQVMFSYAFMRNALLAGTIVALVAGVIGYFMALRRESFAGHTLANIGFAGAAGAALVGVSPIVGLIAFGLLGAAGVGALGERSLRGRRRADIAIGAILTLALALGVLFERLSSAKAASVYAILFGSALGVSEADLREIALTAVITLLGVMLIARPLLFATLDPEVAAARGVPVRLLGVGFVLLLAIAVGEAAQVVGALLIFALLMMPAAIALRLTSRPYVGMALAALLALIITWAGLTLTFYTSYPASFLISALAVVSYLVVVATQRMGRFLAQRRVR